MNVFSVHYNYWCSSWIFLCCSSIILRSVCNDQQMKTYWLIHMDLHTE